jgi:hypothetical protein
MISLDLLVTLKRELGAQSSYIYLTVYICVIKLTKIVEGQDGIGLRCFLCQNGVG